MKPVRLELDYLRRAYRRPAKVSWLLLAVAAAFAADVSVTYLKTRSEIADKEAQLAQARGFRSSGDAFIPVVSGPVSQEELAAARDTIQRLSIPWSNVFRALESAQSEGVALLSIEPDADSGSVTITGEAKSYPAVLTYVAWLAREKTLKDVRLARHEIRQNDPQHAVAFAISANWKEGR